MRPGIPGHGGVQFSRSQFDLENEVIFRPEHDPDKPGGREPGDEYIVIGMLVGAIVVAVLGTLLAVYANIGTVFVGLSMGAVAGGIAGTLVGDWLKKRAVKRKKI